MAGELQARLTTADDLPSDPRITNSGSPSTNPSAARGSPFSSTKVNFSARTSFGVTIVVLLLNSCESHTCHGISAGARIYSAYVLVFEDFLRTMTSYSKYIRLDLDGE